MKLQSGVLLLLLLMLLYSSSAAAAIDIFLPMEDPGIGDSSTVDAIIDYLRQIFGV